MQNNNHNATVSKLRLTREILKTGIVVIWFLKASQKLLKNKRKTIVWEFDCGKVVKKEETKGE